MTEHAKTAVDASAAVVTVGTLADALPEIAALFTIAWTAVRLGEWAVAKFRGRDAG